MSLLVGVTAGALLFRSSSPPATNPGERKVLYCRDPMNPQITSPTPKKSSDGMDYVPAYAELAVYPVIYFLWKGPELRNEVRLAGHALEN